MNLQEKDVHLVHRALDQELLEHEKPHFEKLVAQESDAQNLYQELSQVIDQVNHLPKEDAPYDIAARVAEVLEEELAQAGLVQSSSSSGYKGLWAIAASLVVAIGLLSLNIDTSSDAELVGTLVAPEPQLNQLVYLAKDPDWALGLRIVQDSDFQLLLKDVAAGWDLDPGVKNGITLVRDGDQIEITGHGPTELNFPLVSNKQTMVALPPQFRVELTLDERVYSGDLTMKKN